MSKRDSRNNKMNKLRKAILGIMIQDPTWNTPRLQIKDKYLQESLLDIDVLASKTSIYNCVRYMSLKAEDAIPYHIFNEGMDFDKARSHVKYEHKLPLMIKVRGIGWKEAFLEDLDEDLLNKFGLGKKHYKFSKRRVDRFSKIKEKIKQRKEIDNKK